MTALGCEAWLAGEVLSKKSTAPQGMHQTVSKNHTMSCDVIGMSLWSLGAMGVLGGWETVLWRWLHPHCKNDVVPNKWFPTELSTPHK